jgi:CheY-specific phosphatase CheX
VEEILLEELEVDVDGAQPIVGELRANLLEPFIVATGTALGQMAGAEVVVRAVFQKTMHHALGDIAAVFRLRSASEGFLVLSFPERTAAALAGRILAGVSQQVDANLIRDCAGEIANVVAGQAKALLAETPYRFVFFMPQVVVDAKEFRAPPSLDCLAVIFSSDTGSFALQLFLKLSTSP